MRDSTSESKDAYRAGIAELLNRNRSVSMMQWTADIQALSKSCMLAFENKMHVKEATENLQFFMELEAIRALVENAGTLFTENEDVQDSYQRSAANVKNQVEVTAGSGVSVDSEGVQLVTLP